MLNSYVIETTSVGVLKSSFVLLDTNFILDAIIFRGEAVELIAKFRELECELVTTKAVIIEVLGGTKNPEELKAKINLLELLFGRTLDKIVSLPIDKGLPTTDHFLEFSRQCQKFGTTDFELYLTLKKYHNSHLVLVSRNHTDFTSKLFERKGFITLLGDKEIRTYGIYKSR